MPNLKAGVTQSRVSAVSLKHTGFWGPFWKTPPTQLQIQNWKATKNLVTCGTTFVLNVGKKLRILPSLGPCLLQYKPSRSEVSTGTTAARLLWVNQLFSACFLSPVPLAGNFPSYSIIVIKSPWLDCHIACLKWSRFTEWTLLLLFC